MLTFSAKHALPAVNSLPCPDCCVRMVRYGARDCQLEKCPSCHGIWFAGREFGAFKKALDRFDLSFFQSVNPARDLSVEAISACPRCFEALAAFRYGYNTTVLLGKCPRCHGTWLPMQQLVHLIELSKLGKDLAPHLSAVAQELRKIGAGQERDERFFRVMEFLRRSLSVYR